MGEIFLARRVHPSPVNGRVAIKRLLPETALDETFVTMFLDEARLTMRLDHPHICRVHSSGEDDESHYLVMEWIDGVSLRVLEQRLRERSEPVPTPLVARIGTAIADALHYAHQLTDETGQPLGTVHRDVNPRNIMLGRDGSIKLLDFGFAKSRTQLHKTQPGFVKGKFGYLAPEQLTGDVDARTDVFALGICLYEALVGRRLFDRPTAAQTIDAVRAHAKPPSVRNLRPEVSRPFEQVVQQALEPNPDDRFASAGAMAEALRKALDSESEVATTDGGARMVEAVCEPQESAPNDPSMPPPPLERSPEPRAEGDTGAGPAPWGPKRRTAVLVALVAALGAAAAMVTLL
jgi:serine/threonine protein kinase